MQCQVVVAAIPVPAIMSLVFSVTFTQYITHNTKQQWNVRNTNFTNPNRSFLCALHSSLTDITVASRGLASYALLVECLKPLWFILDSLVLIFLQAMSLCYSGTNITYPRSGVLRPWGLVILYCVSVRSILVLNYAYCGHRNESHGWW